MTTIKLRRGTAAQWTTADPILAQGELGFETDTNKHKIGDGINHWSVLKYFVDEIHVADVVAAEGTARDLAITNAVNGLVNGAPGALDTLKELSDTLGSDENAASALTTLVGGVRDLSDTTHRTALNNAFVGRWQPNTTYAAGAVVEAPDGSLVQRLTTGTSGSSYTSANWQTVATVTGTQAQTELAALYAGLSDAPPTVDLNTPLWIPPTQPAADWTTQIMLTANQRITTYWEPLRAAAPSYITRTQIGTDASGTYPIWRYDFTPEGYRVGDGSLVLSANMHGGEKIGAFNLAKLMDLVVNHWREDKWLAHLRKNLRLRIIPSVNPWGGTDATGPRTNFNGVDIARNWDYLWSAYTPPSSPYFKGTTAFSEPETQAYRDLLLATTDLIGVVDCHDTGRIAQDGAFNYYATMPDSILTPRIQYVRDVIDTFLTGTEVPSFHAYTEPMLMNWATSVLGVRATAIEYEQESSTTTNGGGVLGTGVALDSRNMTRALKWYGNVIMRASLSPPPLQIKRIGPYIWELNFQTGGQTQALPLTTVGELTKLTAAVPCPGAGIMRLDYTLTLGGAIASLDLRPFISQADGPVPTAAGATSKSITQTLDATTSRDAVTLHAALEVHEEPSTSSTRLVKAGVFASTSVNTVNVYRAVGILQFFPGEGTNRRRTYSSSSSGTMAQTYP